MISKFPGKCKTCSKPYPAGAEIHWTREDGGNHVECWENKPKDLFAESEAEQLAERLGFRSIAEILGPADVPEDRPVLLLPGADRGAAAGRDEPEAYF